jgi:hypothetical protein
METVEPVEASELPESEPPMEVSTPPAPLKRERTEGQKKSLEAARAKALLVRRESAALKEKEKAVKSHQKLERKRQVEQAYSAIQPEPESDEEPPPPSVKKKRKPRRVIVTEQSSDSEQDVEVVCFPGLHAQHRLRLPRSLGTNRFCIACSTSVFRGDTCTCTCIR